VEGAAPPAGAAGAVEAIGVAVPDEGIEVPADGEAIGVAAGAAEAEGDAAGVA
jgi:hypothetical protein